MASHLSLPISNGELLTPDTLRCTCLSLFILLQSQNHCVPLAHFEKNTFSPYMRVYFFHNTGNLTRAGLLSAWIFGCSVRWTRSWGTFAKVSKANGPFSNICHSEVRRRMKRQCFNAATATSPCSSNVSRQALCDHPAFHNGKCSVRVHSELSLVQYILACHSVFSCQKLSSLLATLPLQKRAYGADLFLLNRSWLHLFIRSNGGWTDECGWLWDPASH